MNLQRVLILGAGGMLGRSWRELLTRQGVAHDAWTHEDFDLGSDTVYARLLAVGSERPWSLIVNCGAYTRVDQAESEEALATRVNGEAVGEIARCAATLGARVIHYSTDYVFDGGARAPYPIDATLCPMNAYGRTKAAGERLLRESGVASLLIRTSWVYAPWGNNFVRTMVRLMRTAPEKPLRVVDDQRGRPSSAPELAARSWALCQQVESGTFHLADGGECSWYEFALAIRDELGLHVTVDPIPSRDYPTPAVRPAYSVLDTSNADALLGPACPWRLSLNEVLRQLD